MAPQWLFFGILVFGCLAVADAQSDDELKAGGRLISDIMEIFAPGPSQSPSPRRSAAPPLGINRADGPLGRRSSGSAPSDGPWGMLAREMMGMLGAPLTTSTTTTTTPKPPALGIFGDLAKQFKVPGLLKPLFGEANDDPPTTTTIPTLLPPLFPTIPTPGMMAAPPKNEGNWIADDLKNLFDKPKPGSTLDTGGQRLDRFVIRESATDPSDFWANLMGTKWNERGLQWTDGNLRLVNKKGNKFLGSEVAVHDRSIDIPVQRWFDIANGMLSAAASQRLEEK